MEEVFINKVAESGIISLDLEKYLPTGECVLFDLKDFLFMGLILKEKEYRESLKTTDWNIYAGKNVALTCSADAIIPVWAYMLATSYLEPIVKELYFGDLASMQKALLLKNISDINRSEFSEKRVVIKGCGEKSIPESAYVEVTKLLRPIVKSIMYGEPCSTVPIYKTPKKPVITDSV